MSEKLALQAPVDLYGAFWRPEKPDNVITGRLARDGKFLLLTTSPVYKETLDVRTDFLLGDEHDRIDILHGFTTDGPCSLLWLQSPHKAGLTNLQVGKSLTYRQYRVRFCVSVFCHRHQVLPTSARRCLDSRGCMNGFRCYRTELEKTVEVGRLHIPKSRRSWISSLFQQRLACSLISFLLYSKAAQEKLS